MICKSGNFNVTIEKDVDNIPTKHTDLIIELQPKIIEKSQLPEKIQLAIKNIAFNEKKREDSKLLIQSKTKSFDDTFFIDDISGNNCKVLIPKSVPYCYYPLPKRHPECETFLEK